MNPKISIIIPVYNVENYLERCLSSVLNQTLKSIEIIVINDGSTDRSSEILERFSNLDPRVKVINQLNQGVSAARNQGLTVAQGEYIGFVDSDDYIDEMMYEKLYNSVKKYDCDIGVANVFDERGVDREVSLVFETGRVEIDKNCMDSFLEDNICKLGEAVWHKIFRRSLIEQNKLYFYSYREVSSEDSLFNICALACSKSIYYLNEPLYHYMIHESSLSRASESKKDMILRSKQTVQLVERYYYKRQIEIPLFLEYLTYIEMLRGLTNRTYRIKDLKRGIIHYSEMPTFNSTMKKVAFGFGFESYLKKKKSRFSSLYYVCERIFMRLFATLALLKIYYLAACLYYSSLKVVSILKK